MRSGGTIWRGVFAVSVNCAVEIGIQILRALEASLLHLLVLTILLALER
jgi:choline-glycine betaine transporter